MDEKKLLESFAKALNAEHVLDELEQKKQKEQQLLEQLNSTFSKLLCSNEEYKDTIIELVQNDFDYIPLLEDAPGTAGRQPEPELPAKDIVSKSVEMLSKKSQAEIQQAADSLPNGVRKELDIIKKSIVDLHRFASRHSQMGGGGEVKLARLDDVNRSTIMDGLYLRYDAASNKFVFDSPLSGVTQVQADWNEQNTSAVDYIKNKPLLAMDSNGNISASASIVSNNSFTLGSPDQPWANVFVGPHSLTIVSSQPNGIPIVLQNSNDILSVTSGGLSVFDETESFFTFQVDTGGYATHQVPDPKLGTAVLSISSNPSANVFPLVNTVRGGLMHMTGPSVGSAVATIDCFDSVSPSTRGSAIALRRFLGSVDSPSAVTSNTILGAVIGQGYDGNNISQSSYNGIFFYATELQQPGSHGGQIQLVAIPKGTVTGVNVVTIEPSGNTPGLQLKQLNSGITFTDGSFQNTAFNSNLAVTSITVGTGLSQTNTVGAVGIDATGVLTVAGTNNQIIVANVGQNITLSTPQNLNTNATVQFNTLTVQNLNVLGNTTVSNTQSLAGKILYLAYNSTSNSQIDGGGIVLGNTSSSYQRSLLYSLATDTWNLTGSFATGNISANAISGNNLSILNNANFGAAFAGYDYPNAVIQVDQNIASYSQVVEQNHSNSINASTDYVAVNDSGNDSIHYIDLGINSSTWSNSQWTINGPSDGYLYIDSGNLSIGTATAGKVLTFFTGGTLSNNLRVTINDSGMTVVNNVTAASFTGNLTGNVTGNLTGTANNTNYVGSIPASSVVSSTQLSSNLANYVTITNFTSNLANYQTTAGLTANVAKLTSNNSLYLGGIAANQYAYANQIVAQVQSDWNEANTAKVDYIKNKPDLSIYTTKQDFINSAYAGANVAYSNTANLYVIPLGTAIASRNITIDGNNSFVIANNGNYVINYSVQYINTDTTQDDIYIWIRKNGTDVPDTCSVFTINSKRSGTTPSKLVAISPICFSANTGDKIQVVAATPFTTTVSMATIPAITANSTVPNIPEAPATIMTLQEIN